MKLVCGNYGSSNIGDDAILSGLLKLLKNKKDIVVMGANPKYIQKKFNVKSCYFLPSTFKSLLYTILSLNIFKTLYYYIKCDYFILGGGGLFQDREVKAISIWSRQVSLAKLLNKKIIHIGQSIGPIKTKKNLDKVIKILNGSDEIYLRDSFSINFLRKYHLSSNPLPDLAFNNIKDLEYSHNSSSHKQIKQCILSLRDLPCLDNNLKEISSIINKLIDEHYIIVCIPFELKKENDLKAFNKLFQLINNKEKINIIKQPKSLKEVFTLYFNSQLVIGMRLHSIIFSIITQTSFLALSYDIKIKNLLSDNNLIHYYYQLTRKNSSPLQNKIDYILQNDDKIKKELNLVLKNNFKKLNKLNLDI